MFILAMVINTYCNLPQQLTSSLLWIAKKGLVLTLFLIGASLSLSTIKAVGIKPLILAVALWIIIGIGSFVVVTTTI